MPGIGVILNPYSRSNRKNPGRAEELGFIVGDKGSCHATHSVEDVKEVAKQFKEREIEILGLTGGDGTYQKTLTAFINVYRDKPLPKIAFLGGGTMNNVVSCLKISGTPETILSRLIYKYHQHNAVFKETATPMLKVNNQYGFIFGNGLLYQFLCDFNKVEKPTKWTSARLLIQDIFHSLVPTRRGLRICKRIEAEVFVDGKLWPFKNFVTIFAGTVETLGLGFNALYRARKEPGKFQVISFSLPPRQIITSFPLLLMGRKVPSENWLDSTAGEVLIKTKEPQGFMLDGELYDPVDVVKLSMGPTLNVIVE